MARELDTELKDALEETKAFDEEAMAALLMTHEATPITEMPLREFERIPGFSVSQSFHAFTIVKEWKGNRGITQVLDEPGVPTEPPYLANATDYDPTEPSQYFTSPTGQMYRWDGKGRDWYQGKKGSDGQKMPKPRFAPWGEVHKVIIVKHVEFQGVRFPDPAEFPAALATGADWFHHGYGCWIGAGGKPYRDISREVSDRIKLAKERYDPDREFQVAGLVSG